MTMSYGRGFEGTDYQATKRLDISEIAKRLRGQLRDAREIGALPEGMTWTVQIRRFAGGQAIDVTLSGMPDTWTYVSPGTEADWPNNVPTHGGYSPEAKAAIALAQSMLDAYNRDDSDSMIDYFDVRFYGHVTIDDERSQRFETIEREVKAAQKAASAARKAAGLPTKGKDAQVAAARVARDVRRAHGAVWA